MDTPDTPHSDTGQATGTHRETKRTHRERVVVWAYFDLKIAEMRRADFDALQQEFAREQNSIPTMDSQDLTILYQMPSSTHASSFARTCQMPQLRSFGYQPTLTVTASVSEHHSSS